MWPGFGYVFHHHPGDRSFVVGPGAQIGHIPIDTVVPESLVLSVGIEWQQHSKTVPVDAVWRRTHCYAAAAATTADELEPLFEFSALVQKHSPDGVFQDNIVILRAFEFDHVAYRSPPLHAVVGLGITYIAALRRRAVIPHHILPLVLNHRVVAPDLLVFPRPFRPQHDLLLAGRIDRQGYAIVFSDETVIDEQLFPGTYVNSLFCKRARPSKQIAGDHSKHRSVTEQISPRQHRRTRGAYGGCDARAPSSDKRGFRHHPLRPILLIGSIVCGPRLKVLRNLLPRGSLFRNQRLDEASAL